MPALASSIAWPGDLGLLRHDLAERTGRKDIDIQRDFNWLTTLNDYRTFLLSSPHKVLAVRAGLGL